MALLIRMDGYWVGCDTGKCIELWGVDNGI